MRGPTPVPATSTAFVTRVEADRDQLGEILGAGVLGLDQLNAALLGHLWSIDEVDRDLGVAREDSDQDGDTEQAGVVLGEFAAKLDRNPVDRPLGEPLGKAAEFFAERHEGPSASISSGRTAAMLTALVTTPPFNAAVTVRAVTTPARSCASAVEAPRWG